MAKTNQPESLSWTIEKFQNHHAVLVGQAGRLVVSRDLLPSKAKIGDFISCDFFFFRDYAKRKNNLGRAVLEEILREE